MATTKKLSIKPLGDRVVIKPAENKGQEKLASGIILPPTEKEQPSAGTVLAVGPGKYEDGKIVPMQVKVGDEVIFGKYSHEEVKMSGETYYVIAESNILAVIK